MSGFSSDIFVTFFQLMAALGIVLLIAYLLIHKGMGKLLTRRPTSSLLTIQERLPLEPKKTLYLINIQQRSFLIAASEQNVTLLAEVSQPHPANLEGDK